jgi:hypothetical protein
MTNTDIVGTTLANLEYVPVAGKPARNLVAE